MERVDLQVHLREKTGKGSARSLRRAGWVPGIVYGGERPPQPVAVQARRLWQVLHQAGGEHILVNLRFVDGEQPETLTLLKEIQHDPVRGTVEHVDFLRISLDRPIHTTVRLRAVGSSVGAREGGVFEHLLREVEVECLPLEIPDEIEFDVTNLGIGQSIHVSDLRVPERVRLLTNPETVVALVATPVHVVVEAARVAEAPAEEAQAAQQAAESAKKETT